jgi:Fe-S-cluster containining protein
MNELRAVDLRSFRKEAKTHKRKFRRFLSKIEKNPPRGINKLATEIEKEVWHTVDCLSCAKCCKTMTPTFSNADINRISAFLGQTPDEFKEKYLRRERGGDRDWLNRKEPCQFLDLKTNHCSIYEVRPSDCAGFPHLSKSLRDFSHVHKQNLECCPASFKMVEKMMEKIENRE